MKLRLQMAMSSKRWVGINPEVEAEVAGERDSKAREVDGRLHASTLAKRWGGPFALLAASGIPAA